MRAAVTIRTMDVGADKPLDRCHRPRNCATSMRRHPALGLRAIRWSLSGARRCSGEQLRAILRASAYGAVHPDPMAHRARSCQL